MTDDLLAMLIEVNSVTAAGRQIRKPIEVPRPKDQKTKAPEPEGSKRKDDAYGKAIGVLAATSRPRG